MRYGYRVQPSGTVAWNTLCAYGPGTMGFGNIQLPPTGTGMMPNFFQTPSKSESGSSSLGAMLRSMGAGAGGMQGSASLGLPGMGGKVFTRESGLTPEQEAKRNEDMEKQRKANEAVKSLLLSQAPRTKKLPSIDELKEKLKELPKKTKEVLAKILSLRKKLHSKKSKNKFGKKKKRKYRSSIPLHNRRIMSWGRKRKTKTYKGERKHRRSIKKNKKR